MSEQAPDKIWSGIQINKVIAGTLAALAATVLGSFLGVAGTLAGAALASIVGSVGTEIFNNSIKRGQKHLATTVAPAFIKAPAAVGTPPVEAATEEENPAHTVPADEKPSLKDRLARVRWKHVSVAAVTLFALTMGTVWVFEAFTGKPLSATVKNTSATGSTLFGTTNTSSETETDGDSGTSTEQSPEPSQAPETDSSAPSGGGTSSAEPTPTTTETTTTPGEGSTTEPGSGDSTGDTGTGDSTTDSGGSTTQDSTGDGSGSGTGGGGEQTQGSNPGRQGTTDSGGPAPAQPQS
jgi:hypothetical protein